MAIGSPIDYDKCSAVQFSWAVNNEEAIGPVPVSDLQGIVLAGVHAWCSGILDELICWPLVPIAGRPLIAHVLDWLRSQGMRSVSLCANSDTTSLHRYLGDGKAMDLALEYYEDVMPRGPAGSVRDAVVASEAKYFVVTHGTIVPRIELDDLLRVHLESKAILTLVATRPGPGGSPDSTVLQPAGIYIFSREALRHIPTTGYQDIKETLVPLLHDKGMRVATHVVHNDAVHQVTDLNSYALVNRCLVEALCRRTGGVDEYVRKGEALVHKSVRIESSARLIGPVIIGPNCVIENEVIISGPTTIGDNCIVCRRGVISRSSLWSYCTIGPEALVDDCILTNDSVIDGGLVVRETVCASYRHRRSRFVPKQTSFLSRAGAKVQRHDLAVVPAGHLEPVNRRAPKRPRSSPLVTTAASIGHWRNVVHSYKGKKQ